MELTERTQAFITARYYVRLKERFGDRGVAAFRLAVRYYAEQRGRRMAQRAIADGEPLTYAAYRRYGEWVNTDAIRARGEENRSETVSISPDFVNYVSQCPWNTEFREQGLIEAGSVYCSEIDPSLCRGFNPAIQYLAVQSLNDHDICIQKVVDSGLTAEDLKAKKKRDGIKSFNYHCAHSYWSFRKMAAGIFGKEGEEIADGVLADTRESWGEEAAGILEKYRQTDFDVNTEELTD